MQKHEARTGCHRRKGIISGEERSRVHDEIAAIVEVAARRGLKKAAQDGAAVPDAFLYLR